ncbi:MAG: Uncharacterised protein [Synechococcus sp. CC9902]|nr:MAG: Uncharacterised protein [Synechococcus sp. CC9902]
MQTFPVEQLLQGQEQLLLIERSPLPQQRCQPVSNLDVDRSDSMQFAFLVRGSGQNHKLPLHLLGLPTLQLFEAVTPVPATAEQSHNNQPGFVCCGCQIVVQLSRMGQTIQSQGPDSVLPLRVLQKNLIQTAEIR